VILAHTSVESPSHLELDGISVLALPKDNTDQMSKRIKSWAPDVIHVHLCSDLDVLETLLSLKTPLFRSFHDYTSLCLRRGRRRFPGDRCQRALGRTCVMFGCSLGAPAQGSALPGWKSISNKLEERSHYQHFQAAIVGSQYMKTVLLKNGFASDRICLAPYFSKFDRYARETLGRSQKLDGEPGKDRPLELLFTGQAVVGKGLKVLVEALMDLPGKWRLTVVSDGPDLEAIKALATHSCIAPRIDFKAWLPQSALSELYARADLLVVPSVWDDPGPLVGLEALSMGTPVLGFPVGGIPDYVIDGVTGYLAKEVSVSALRSALNKVLSDTSVLPTMGERGRALIVANHGRQEHIAEILRIYSSALSEPKQQQISISSTRLLLGEAT
jgi:glycosyltransferase involved in cell wall biosynthesis